MNGLAHFASSTYQRNTMSSIRRSITHSILVGANSGNIGSITCACSNSSSSSPESEND